MKGKIRTILVLGILVLAYALAGESVYKTYRLHAVNEKCVKVSKPMEKDKCIQIIKDKQKKTKKTRLVCVEYTSEIKEVRFTGTEWKEVKK